MVHFKIQFCHYWLKIIVSQIKDIYIVWFVVVICFCLFQLYIRTFNVNLEEAEIEDLKYYRNLGEFFKRRIKSSARTIDQSHDLVSSRTVIRQSFFIVPY